MGRARCAQILIVGLPRNGKRPAGCWNTSSSALIARAPTKAEETLTALEGRRVGEMHALLLMNGAENAISG
jgi:hypothetical protein